MMPLKYKIDALIRVLEGRLFTVRLAIENILIRLEAFCGRQTLVGALIRKVRHNIPMWWRFWRLRQWLGTYSFAEEIEPALCCSRKIWSAYHEYWQKRDEKPR